MADDRPMTGDWLADDWPMVGHGASGNSRASDRHLRGVLRSLVGNHDVVHELCRLPRGDRAPDRHLTEIHDRASRGR
jgi:hypothetical protein